VFESLYIYANLQHISEIRARSFRKRGEVFERLCLEKLLNVPPNVRDPVKLATVWSFIPPSTSFIAPLSKPIFPERKTNPFALIAWEKTKSDAGASEVCTSVMEAMICKDQDSLDIRLRDV
jgi:hypothetical protein